MAMTMDRMMEQSQASAAAPVRVSYAAVGTPIGTLQLFGTERGLLSLALPSTSRAAVEAWLARQVGTVAIHEDAAAHAALLAQLEAYFAGTLRAFEVPLDVRGTPFQCRVWEEVARVPYGATSSYGAIARGIGRPAAVRAVGAANGANPLPLIVPCHRIIGADGTLTGYGGGLEIKRRLLALERA